MNRMAKHRALSAWLLVSCASLSGCGGDGLDDLRRYAEEVKAKPAQPITPLPEIKPQEPYAYAASQLRDPFTPPPPESTARSGGNGIAPDLSRSKEPLEAYPLDTLRMVGSFELRNEKWSLVSAPDGGIYRIRPDNYLGQNNGKVVRISDAAIELVEIIEDGQGGWMERNASLALSEESTEGGKP